MFAFSVTFKLLSWTLALKHGDAGRWARPWILGAALAFVFAGFDLCTVILDLHGKIILSIAYLISAIVVMNIYYRVHSLALALLVGAVGTAVLFFGVPYFITGFFL